MAIFSVAARLRENVSEWLGQVRRAEELGFDSLYVSDHPGVGVSPFVALAAAAAVTSRIKLGSYVLNAGVREPIHIASDVATLDLLSGGRAVFGIGTGHTPAEWEAIGRTRPGVRGRVDHCIAVTEATQRYLAGEGMEWPRPVQERVPLLIGGGNTRLLGWAAEHADLIGLAGLGKTLADGHNHTARWSADEIDKQVELCGGKPTEALVQLVQITDDAGAVYDEWAKEEGGVEAADLALAPFILVGTRDEIRSKIADVERRWGIARFAIRGAGIEDVAEVLQGGS